MTKNTIFVEKCEIASRELWSIFCRNVSSATFFHTTFWADIFCTENSNSKPISFLLTFNDGHQLLIPVIIESKLLGLFKRKISMAAGTFGGFLAESNVESKYIQTGMNYILRHGDWTIRENPFDLRMKEIEFEHSSEDFTQCVYVKDGYDLFVNNTDSCHRKAVKRAMHSGLTVNIAEDWSEWQEYYKVYEQSMSRWKRKGLSSRSFYTTGLFKRMYDLEHSQRKLWIVKKGSEIASGILCFYWNEHAVAWHGSGSEKFFNDRPNNLLYDTAIHDACDNGFTWFDCNPSGGYKGVIEFKKHLGAQSKRSRIIEKKSFLLKAIHNVKRVIH